MRTRGLVLISELIALIGLMGCTRGAGTTSTLSFRLQNRAGQLATTGSDTISNVFINVTSPGMSPVFFQCDSHSGARKACHPNADGSIDVSLQVDRGSSRLVQALVVYENTGTPGVDKFRYGAAKTDTTNDSNLDIALADAGVGSIQGHVYGRYLDGSSAGGPSGVLEARFLAPDGLEMTVIRSPMIAGWFQLILFDTAAFNYYINDPTPRPLFSNANLSSPDFTAAGPQVVRINVPAYDRPNSSGTETEGPQKIIVGFFGPAAGTSVACYDNRSAVAIANAFQVGTQTPLNYNGVSGGATDVTHETGGQGFNMASPTSPCLMDATNFVSHIIFDETQLRNGKDSVAGFRGPFRMIDPSMSSYATGFYDSVAQKMTVNWSLLPDTPKYINGLQLFVRNVSATTTNSDDIYTDNGVDCPAIASDSTLGFRSVGDLGISSTQQSGSLIAPSITGIANVQFVLCPYLNGASRTYLSAGVEVRAGMMATLDMKLVGSDTVNSLIDGPGLGGTPYTFLKSSLTNNFHTLIIQAGKTRLVANDLAGVDYSIDNGATWSGFSLQTVSFGSGPSIATVPISSPNAGFITAISGTSDTVIKLRAKVTPAAQALYGIINDTYISGPITLLGATSCPTQGSIEAYDPIHGSVLASATDIFNPTTGIVNNLSDLTIKLRWAGCPTAYEPIDYVQISGTFTPTNCLSRADFVSDPGDPLAIHFSPVDTLASGCSISGGTLGFATPSNAGSDAANFSLGTLSIPHSP